MPEKTAWIIRFLIDVNTWAFLNHACNSKMLSEMNVIHLHPTVGAAEQLRLQKKNSSLLNKPVNHCWGNVEQNRLSRELVCVCLICIPYSVSVCKRVNERKNLNGHIRHQRSIWLSGELSSLKIRYNQIQKLFITSGRRSSLPHL